MRLFAISVNLCAVSGDNGMDRNALEFRGEVVTDREGLSYGRYTAEDSGEKSILEWTISFLHTPGRSANGCFLVAYFPGPV